MKHETELSHSLDTSIFKIQEAAYNYSGEGYEYVILLYGTGYATYIAHMLVTIAQSTQSAMLTDFRQELLDCDKILKMHSPNSVQYAAATNRISVVNQSVSELMKQIQDPERQGKMQEGGYKDGEVERFLEFQHKMTSTKTISQPSPAKSIIDL